MSEPPIAATMRLTSPTSITCPTCQDGDGLGVTLGVALAVPVVRITCAIHGVLAQYPLAPGALAYYALDFQGLTQKE